MKSDRPLFAGPAVNVLVVDEDEGWRRALRRGLEDIGVRSVRCVHSGDELAPALAQFGPAIVLTELTLERRSLGGLAVVESALRAGVPAAIVAGGPRTRFDELRPVPFLSKFDVSRASLRALLRYLERGLRH